MVRALAERQQRVKETISGKSTSVYGSDRKVSDSALFRQMGNQIKVVKK